MLLWHFGTIVVGGGGVDGVGDGGSGRVTKVMMFDLEVLTETRITQPLLKLWLRGGDLLSMRQWWVV